VVETATVVVVAGAVVVAPAVVVVPTAVVVVAPPVTVNAPAGGSVKAVELLTFQLAVLLMAACRVALFPDVTDMS
jgi:hypothetical protein